MTDKKYCQVHTTLPEKYHQYAKKHNFSWAELLINAIELEMSTDPEWYLEETKKRRDIQIKGKKSPPKTPPATPIKEILYYFAQNNITLNGIMTPNIWVFGVNTICLSGENSKIYKFFRSIKKQLPLSPYVSYRLMEEEEERKSILRTTTQTYGMVFTICLNLCFGGVLFW